MFQDLSLFTNNDLTNWNSLVDTAISNGSSGSDNSMFSLNNSDFNFGMNIPTLKLGLSGLNSLGNLYGAFQANRLANEQFDFTKKITNTNLANQTKAYNTRLNDRIRSRAVAEGMSNSDVQSYLEKNRL